MTYMYGNYRHRKFSDVFPDAETFGEEAAANPLTGDIPADAVERTFYLLYGKYGNSVIASSDETQFKFQLFSIMFDTAPTWIAKLKVQKALQNMTDDEIRTGYTQISNHAYNPSTEPSADAMDPLKKIDEQNFNGAKKGLVDSYAAYWEMLRTNLSKGYVNQFAKLFLSIVEPEEPLWYITDEEDE